MAAVPPRVLCILALLFVTGLAHDPHPVIQSSDLENQSSLWGDTYPSDLENQPANPLELMVDYSNVFIHNQQAPPAEIEAMKRAYGSSLFDYMAPPPMAVEPPPTLDVLPVVPAPAYQDGYRGVWELHSNSSGVSAMHMNIIPITNQVIMYDATISGPSNIKLTPQQGCHIIDPKKDVNDEGNKDCYAHSVEYNSESGELRPLKLDTDTWCSSGSLTIEGSLVSVGGNKEGAKTVRYLSPCMDCEWREYPNTLIDARWYATQAVLADNRYIVVGGRASYSYEYMPVEGEKSAQLFNLSFLRETNQPESENNLYPFVHLSTDGNVFIFANDRSIILNPYQNKIIRELPVLEGGARNYPASGMSALHPIRLDNARNSAGLYPAKVMICGGALKDAYQQAFMNANFVPALDDCNTIEITDETAQWKKEKMPSPRVMGDMLLLPNTDILMINGAKRGTSAWGLADDPNLAPVLYKTGETDPSKKFVELAPTKIPRMYHSSSTVLPDGRILVGGSNTHERYIFDGPFPTELRIEKFWPPYLFESLRAYRPNIVWNNTDTKLTYETHFKVVFKSGAAVDRNNIKVTMYSPTFSTHGVNMNQRLLVLEIKDMVEETRGAYTITAMSPASPALAPAGYYLLFVNNGVVPSVGTWVQIKEKH